MARLKVLAVAAATGRLGYVFFNDDELVDWRMSHKASQSRKRAVAQVEKWIDYLKPDVVITEDVVTESRKGARTKKIIAAIADCASNLPLNDVSISRVQTFDNKYEEATVLAARYPDILPWMPKRPRIWESEPRNMVYFEALALALEVVRRPNEAVY